ncbi:MAG: hypothetical protein LM555_03300 [Desulfurococcaceae archaeon]|nr:hypothetical protein [Desulfurococcaceae archaeon]
MHILAVRSSRAEAHIFLEKALSRLNNKPLLLILTLLVLIAVLYLYQYSSKQTSTHNITDSYYWLKPGVYFTYLFNTSSPIALRASGEWYVANMFLINYNIVDATEDMVIVNYTITALNATHCSDWSCEVIREWSLNKSFTLNLTLNIYTLGAYTGNSWISEWLYLASPSQIREEIPKLVNGEPSIGLGFVYNSKSLEESTIVNALFDYMCEDMSEDLVECIQNSTCMSVTSGKLGFVFNATFNSNYEPRVVTIFFHDAYYLGFLHQQRVDLHLDISGRELSREVVATLALSSFDHTKSHYYLVLENTTTVNNTCGWSRVLKYSLKLHPVKLYVLIYTCENIEFSYYITYNPSTRRVGGVFPVSEPPRLLYDYYTGVLLYGEFRGNDALKVIETYTTPHLISKVGWARGGYTGLSAKATLKLIDTNINFEKQAVETGHSYTVINTALLVALIITVLYYLEKNFTRVRIKKLKYSLKSTSLHHLHISSLHFNTTRHAPQLSNNHYTT